MALFSVKFERIVKTYETVHRVFEAATEQEAREHADRMASQFNSECPDDVEEVQGCADFGAWEAEVGDDVDEHAAPDYVAGEV